MQRLIAEEHWSPVQIAGRIAVERPACGSTRHTKRNVADVEIQTLAQHPESRTVTLDRGMEVADFRKVERARGAVCYFAPPHHPWQRGSNENTNRLIQEHFPKGTDFTHISDRDG